MRNILNSRKQVITITAMVFDDRLTATFPLPGKNLAANGEVKLKAEDRGGGFG